MNLSKDEAQHHLRTVACAILKKMVVVIVAGRFYSVRIFILTSPGVIITCSSQIFFNLIFGFIVVLRGQQML